MPAFNLRTTAGLVLGLLHATFVVTSASDVPIQVQAGESNADVASRMLDEIVSSATIEAMSMGTRRLELDADEGDAFGRALSTEAEDRMMRLRKGGRVGKSHIDVDVVSRQLDEIVSSATIEAMSMGTRRLTVESDSVMSMGTRRLELDADEGDAFGRALSTEAEDRMMQLRKRATKASASTSKADGTFHSDYRSRATKKQLRLSPNRVAASAAASAAAGDVDGSS